MHLKNVYLDNKKRKKIKMNNSFLNNDDISDFLKYLAYELNFDKGQIIDVVVTPHKYKIEYNIFLERNEDE